MNSIAWLHLTDFHQGMDGQGWLWPTMRAEFFQDLEYLRDKVGIPWDLVLFTGDLVQTGKQDEFHALEENLAKLWERLKQLGSEPLLLAVPGNHDLVRPPSKSGTVKAFSRWWDDPDIASEFWKQEPNEYNELVQRAFSPYSAWQQSSRFHARVLPGYLPGDFAFTFECKRNGLRLGIIGLNSTFLQLTGGGYTGRLALEPRQLQAVCQGDSAAWIEQHDATLLMTHHPESWLHPKALETFEQDILARDNFTVHLHGHMHIPAAESRRQGGGATRRIIQGPSLFGLEEYEEVQKKQQRIHGYGAGRLDFEDSQATLHYWPRIAMVKQGNYRKLGADPSADLDKDEKWSESFRRRSTEQVSAGLSQVQNGLSQHDYFLRTYRQRLSASYERWDLQAIGVAQTAGESPVAANLSDMYLPLRFNTGDGKKKQASALSPEELVQSPAPIIIRGGAGAGKTTWMRFTFRAVLRMEGGLPFMVVLRDLARRWSEPECKGQARSIDAYLQSLLEEHVPGVGSRLLGELLNDSKAPRPVLLVDGWDEVGPLAEELRTKLFGFMRQYPRVLVVVTSRPYGEARPSSSEGFKLLDIEPLSDEEVQELARRFFAFCYGKEQESATSRANRFWTAVRGLNAALDLAKTPLLLTMMLFISRSRPLPDKRHQLYQACIDNLLAALPKQKEDEGALQSRQYWRPADAEERMRVVAEIAWGLHHRRKKDNRSFIIVATLEEIEGMLPLAWPQGQSSGMSHSAMRRGFIYWLAGPAGLLSERADGTFSFVHLSFQEFLVAWHLNASTEKDSRLEIFKRHLADPYWIEVLRLWAALLAAQSDERLQTVLDAISLDSSDAALFLLGSLYADGLGPTASFEEWCERFIKRIGRHPANTRMKPVLEGWAVCNQNERKNYLVEKLQKLSPGLSLTRWLIVSEAARSLVQLQQPPENTMAGAALRLDYPNSGFPLCARVVASGRVLSVLGKWPEEYEQLELLQAWPGMRRTIGLRHQLAIISGAEKGNLSRGFRGALERYKEEESIPREEILDLDQFGNPSTLSSIPLVMAITALFAAPPESSIAFWASDTAVYSFFAFKKSDKSYTKGSLTHASFANLRNIKKRRSPIEVGARIVAEDFMRRETSSSREIYNRLAAQWGVDPNTSWIAECALLDSLSPGLQAARHSIASTQYHSHEGKLISAACKESLLPDQFGGATAQALAVYPADGNPIWPALARHLIGKASTQDRQVLVEAVRAPEQWPPPLNWGLQYIVRGDLMFEDGTEVQLDDLARAEGLEPLPLLEDAAPLPKAFYEYTKLLLANSSFVDISKKEWPFSEN